MHEILLKLFIIKEEISLVIPCFSWLVFGHRQANNPQFSKVHCLETNVFSSVLKPCSCRNNIRPWSMRCLHICPTSSLSSCDNFPGRVAADVFSESIAIAQHYRIMISKVSCDSKWPTFAVGTCGAGCPPTHAAHDVELSRTQATRLEERFANVRLPRASMVTTKCQHYAKHLSLELRVRLKSRHTTKHQV